VIINDLVPQTNINKACAIWGSRPSTSVNLFYRFVSLQAHFLPQNHQGMRKGEMLRKKLVRYNHFGTCTGAQELNHGRRAHSNRSAFVMRRQGSCERGLLSG
jgi:hypothetical protein